jgi:hypothetical protein
MCPETLRRFGNRAHDFHHYRRDRSGRMPFLIWKIDSHLRTAVLQAERGQIFAERSRYVRNTPQLRRRLPNFPWRTISIRPAASSFLRWWNSVAALTLCFLCSPLPAAGPAQAPIPGIVWQ